MKLNFVAYFIGDISYVSEGNDENKSRERGNGHVRTRVVAISSCWSLLRTRRVSSVLQTEILTLKGIAFQGRIEIPWANEIQSPPETQRHDYAATIFERLWPVTPGIKSAHHEGLFQK